METVYVIKRDSEYFQKRFEYSVRWSDSIVLATLFDDQRKAKRKLEELVNPRKHTDISADDLSVQACKVTTSITDTWSAEEFIDISVSTIGDLVDQGRTRFMAPNPENDHAYEWMELLHEGETCMWVHPAGDDSTAYKIARNTAALEEDLEDLASDESDTNEGNQNKPTKKEIEVPDEENPFGEMESDTQEEVLSNELDSLTERDVEEMFAFFEGFSKLTPAEKQWLCEDLTNTDLISIYGLQRGTS